MNPRSILVAVALFAAVASPLAAKQAPAVESGAAAVSVPATTTGGPRVRDELRRVEPTLGTSRAPVTRHRSSETITISTLVLVLLIVVVVLLVA